MNIDLLHMLRQDFTQAFVKDSGVFFLTTNSENILDSISKIKNKYQFKLLNFIMAMDIGNERPEQFDLRYHFINVDDFSSIELQVILNEDSEVSSIGQYYKNSICYETELWDQLGINFIKQNKIRVLNHQSISGHPLLKNFKSMPLSIEDINNSLSEESSSHSKLTYGKMSYSHTESYGPIFDKGLIGPKVNLEVRGDLILDSSYEQGYFHRSIEKLVENKEVFLVTPLLERIGKNSGGQLSLLYCMCIEDIGNIEISEKSKAVRMAFFELFRISEHLNLLANTFKLLEIPFAYQLTVEMIESLDNYFSKISKRYGTMDIFTIGGFKNLNAHGLTLNAIDFCSRLSKNIEELSRFIVRDKFCISRLSIGTLDRKDAFHYGITGPALRACGPNLDLRKVSPIYFYSDIDFQIPLGINGNSYDRLLVRVEELRQSVNIIGQIFDSLPGGELESELKYTKNFDEMFAGVSGESYNIIEGGNGTLGIYARTKAGKVSDFRIRSVSHNNALALSNILKNETVDDLGLIVASLNLDPYEMDR